MSRRVCWNILHIINRKTECRHSQRRWGVQGFAGQRGVPGQRARSSMDRCKQGGGRAAEEAGHAPLPASGGRTCRRMARRASGAGCGTRAPSAPRPARRTAAAPPTAPLAPPSWTLSRGGSWAGSGPAPAASARPGPGRGTRARCRPARGTGGGGCAGCVGCVGVWGDVR